jgi:hypothetical protein
MLNGLVDRVIRKEEKTVGARLDYLREVASVSTAGLAKIALLAPFARHRKRLPKTAYHLAKISATLHEDRGTCAQWAVNQAVSDGVPVHYIRSVLDGAVEVLPPALQDICSFARAVAQGWDQPDLREILRARYGREALVELAFAIASARLYPTLERAIGHAQRRSTQLIAV